MDIHGPWVERVYTDPDGKERGHCVAVIEEFRRDYAAFNVMASSAGQGAVAPYRGIPEEPCYQWQRHLAEDRRRGVTEARRNAKRYGWMPPEPFDWQRCWREGEWRDNQYGSCFGHSWLSTDEVEEAQRRYIAYYENWRDTNPDTFAGRDITPYSGFDVALVVMREAERIYGLPVRLVFCFDV